MAKCKAKTLNGKACRMQAIHSGRYCFTHSPEVGAARAMAHKKGGERNRTPHAGDESILPREVNSLEDANRILVYTLSELLIHENSIARARVLLSLYEAFVKSIEIGEIEKRITALEQRSR